MSIFVIISVDHYKD
jgi:hypothetical protein